jgi:O-antigen ligase
MNAAPTAASLTLPPYSWCIWIAAALLLNFQLGSGSYGSQLVLVLFLLWWAVRSIEALSPRLFWVPAASVAFTAVILGYSGQSAGRVVPELVKIVSVPLLAFVFVDMITDRATIVITRALPLIVSLVAVYFWFFGGFDYYDPVLRRFGIVSFGSPNTTAYVLAFTLLFTHHALRTDAALPLRVLLRICWAWLLVALLATQSRGGVLIYVAGWFVLASARTRLILLASTAGAIAAMLLADWSQDFSRLNLLLDLRDTGGTSRLEIWSRLLEHLSRSPVRLLTGVGPGTIDYWAYNSNIRSAHSTYVEVLYSFGLIGITCLLIALGWLAVRVYRSNGSLLQRRFQAALLAGLVTSFAFDSYPLTAQILWLTPLVLAIIYASGRESRSNEPAMGT